MADVMMGDLVMDATQMFTGTIPPFPDPNGFVDVNGAPARVDMTNNPPFWSTEGDWGTITSGADALTDIQLKSADGIPNDDPARTGRSILTVDVDRGAGVENLNLIWNMTVNSIPGPRVTGLAANPFGAPVPKV